MGSGQADGVRLLIFHLTRAVTGKDEVALLDPANGITEALSPAPRIGRGRLLTMIYNPWPDDFLWAEPKLTWGDQAGVEAST